MKEISQIWENEIYQEYYKRLIELEREREFCKHSIEHFLDVARLTYIMALEEGVSVNKKIIYGAALLHDLGRVQEHSNGTPHHIASAQIAEEVLTMCDFSKEEIEIVCQAIEGHRTGFEKENEGYQDNIAAWLSDRFRIADKRSRQCFNCSKIFECNWPNEKKNLRITI